MATIVVGVDGSEYAKAALLFAVEEAKLREAKLRLVCAWELPSESWGEFPPLEETLEKFRENADEVVAEAASLVKREAAGVEVESLVVEGQPGKVLLEQSSDAEMIVVGNRGHGGFTGLLLGSVSQQVVGNAEVPVVVIPSPEAS